MLKKRLRNLALVIAGVVLLTVGLTSATASAGMNTAWYAARNENSVMDVAKEYAGKYLVKSGDTLSSIAGQYGITASELQWANGMDSDRLTTGQLLVIPTRDTRPFGDILKEKGITNPGKSLVIHVDKTDHELGITWNGTLLKSYHVELSEMGLGDKAVSGDHKTPEGTFYIAEKSVLNPPDQYLGTRWMELSYPNIEDANRGLQQGLISRNVHDQIVAAINSGGIPPQDTALGGGVGIHGGSTPALGKDWTWGCTGLTNKDVEDFYGYVAVGTKVIIQL